MSFEDFVSLVRLGLTVEENARVRDCDIRVGFDAGLLVVEERREVIEGLAALRDFGYPNSPLPRRIKPKPLLGRFIREGDCGPFCGVCGSSFRLRWGFFRSKRCVNSGCVNSGLVCRVCGAGVGEVCDAGLHG